jgi:hypothetical protein
MPQKKSRAPIALKLSITPQCSSLELGDLVGEPSSAHPLFAAENKMLVVDENVVITGVDLGQSLNYL